jgi:hypothetical protein
MKKRGRLTPKEKVLIEISKKIVKFIALFFAYLGYYAGVRPYFLVNHGSYSTGFLDGLVVAITLFAVLFYISSIFARAKFRVSR